MLIFAFSVQYYRREALPLVTTIMYELYGTKLNQVTKSKKITNPKATRIAL